MKSIVLMIIVTRAIGMILETGIIQSYKQEYIDSKLRKNMYIRGYPQAAGFPMFKKRIGVEPNSVARTVSDRA
jgi:hypothetical protein